MAARLRMARERAGYLKAADAARDLNVEYPTYAQHENGNGGFTRHVPKYAKFFKVRAEWLLSNRGPMTEKGKDPVLDVFERIPPELQEDGLRYLNFLAQQGASKKDR